MKKLIVPVIIVTSFLIFAFATVKVIIWKVQKEKCEVRAQCCGPNGISFSGITATIQFDEDKPENSYISAAIDATTADAGDSKTTAEAKFELETSTYRQIKFESVSIKKNGVSNAYIATGNLTMKGITKKIELPFTFDSQKDRTDKFPFQFKEIFYGKMSIHPKDFKINKGPDPLVILLTIPVTK